jgi:hypothetical protein
LLRHRRRGLETEPFVQVVVNYLVSSGSLLHSDLLVGAIWLVIMAMICYYWSSPVFPFDDIDEFGLWQNCFDQNILENLKKYICRH